MRGRWDDGGTLIHRISPRREQEKTDLLHGYVEDQLPPAGAGFSSGAGQVTR